MNNLTAKHAHKFNRAAVQVDKKKAAKAGKMKHKTRYV